MTSDDKMLLLFWIVIGEVNEAIPIGEAQEASGSYAQQGIVWCNKLFSIEQDLTYISPEDRYNKRFEFEKPVFEAFWSQLYSFFRCADPNWPRPQYNARNQRPYLENYLLDGRCGIIETAKTNDLDTFTYLEQLLMHMADRDHNLEFLDEMMPGRLFMQDTCGK